MAHTSRPVGISSRLRRARGDRRPWTSPDGYVVDLPVTLDIVCLAVDGQVEWTVEGLVDCVDGRPTVVRVSVESRTGLDVVRLQNEFRWATPLDVVTVTVPQLLARRLDPFDHDFAVAGYPDAAQLVRAPSRSLSDAFLREVAQRYLALGRGYAQVLARDYQVTPRTVVSWVEKARARGILGATTPGSVGGYLLADSAGA